MSASVAVVGVMVWALSPLALLYVLTDGLLAVGILLAAGSCGMWLVPILFPSQSLGLRWHALIGGGLGVGLLSLMMLGAGLAGLLSRPLVLGVLIGAGVAGGLRVMILLMRHQAQLMPEDRLCDPQPPAGRFQALSILLLALMPPLALSLLVATVPPGVIWAEEGFGYDVLEYHLQVPKEFHQAGRISYLPHNIYSNFPMNAEMLSLLAMITTDDPIEAATLAKFLNALLGVLFVLAAWVVGREYHPTAGLVCALLAGTAPWLMYLCGVAYVENGMLLFGMLSAACLCRYAAGRSGDGAGGRLALLAGLFAGFACGFKYTAVAMLALPLGAVLLVLSMRREPHSGGGEAPDAKPRALKPVTHALLFGLGVMMSFSPWLIKNVTMTGNPVFPLAYGWLGADDGVWTDDLAAQWQRGHEVQTTDASLRGRLVRFKERVLLDRRLGWWLIALALPVLFSKARTRFDVGLFAVFVCQVVVWLLFTHLFARFAVGLLIPLCILAGRSAICFDRTWYRAGYILAVIAVVVFNLFSSGAIYADELFRKNASIHGHIELFYRGCDPERTMAGYVRQKLSPDDRVLMVGGAAAFYMPENVDYCVVFNRNPLADAVARAGNDDDIIRWLNVEGYTHLLVFWNEMERLRRTYGFWEELTPTLFRRLEQTGLGRIHSFGSPVPYVTLFEVRRMLPLDSD